MSSQASNRNLVESDHVLYVLSSSNISGKLFLLFWCLYDYCVISNMYELQIQFDLGCELLSLAHLVFVVGSQKEHPYYKKVSLYRTSLSLC